MKPKSSPIWRFFVEKNESLATCTICQKEYSRKGRTTTALKSHLKSMHPDAFEQFESLDAYLKIQQAEIKEQSRSCSSSIEARSQLTIQPAVVKIEPWDTSHQKSKEMDYLIGEMIALQDLPFNFVDGIGFRQLLAAAVPQYKLRGHQYFTKLICDDLYNLASNKIKQLIGEFEKISIASDIWTEMRSGVSLLRLTAHGINEDVEKMSFLLKCEVMEERHTGEAISAKLQSLFQEWGIKSNAVHCIIHDRGSNMIQTLWLSDIEDFDCSIHKLQRCINNVTKTEEWLQQLVSKLKRIAIHFNHSPTAQEKLRKIQTETLSQSALSTVQDCPTRWNSTYYMMERFLKIKDSIVMYLSKERIVPLTPDDWLNVEKYVKIMRPFEEVTREFSGSQITISSVIPFVQVIVTTLQAEELKTDSSNDFKRVIKKLIDELNSRYSDLSNNFLCTISTYLDPRYKTKFFNEITKHEVEAELIRILFPKTEDVIFDTEECGPAQPKKKKESDVIESVYEAQPSTSKTRHSLELLESILSSDSEDTACDQLVDPTAMLKQILQDYNKEKRLPLKEDPLKWWQMNANKYWLLLPLVRRFLSAPPSSVASEQWFSGSSLIYDEKRGILEGEKAAKLLFLKYNLPLLKLQY